MVQITFMNPHAHGHDATTSWTIPTWAPDIRYATTGTGSKTLECLTATTSLGAGADDSLRAAQIDLKSYSTRKIRPADNTTVLPIQITMRYEAVGELTRA